MIKRSGMALLVVMVLTMLIALAAYRFSFTMESQYRLTRLTEERLQARMAAMSGLEFAADQLEQPFNQRFLSGVRGEQNNPLAGIVLQANNARADSLASIADAEFTKWRFSLISAGSGSTNETNEASYHQFEFENESAKLSIPRLLEWERASPGTAKNALMRLPGATAEIIDYWLRKQGIVRYETLSDSIAATGSVDRNTPINSIDAEQLEARWHWLWCGGDLNQNYRLDPLELQLRDQLFSDSDLSANGERANADRANQMQKSPMEEMAPMGWMRYLTSTSGQRNETIAGVPRINLNNNDLSELQQQLLSSWPIEWVNFVIAIRQHGPSNSRAADAVSAATAIVDLSRPATYQLKSVLDLIDAQVAVSIATGEKQTLQSPFSSDIASASNYLARLLDETSIDDRPFLENAIDFNQAPLEVLAAVPGMSETLAQSIVQRRSSLGNDQGNSSQSSEPSGTIAWLYTERLVDLAQLKQLNASLIGRSDVYSFQSVGFRDERSPVARYTATVDARHIPARISHKRPWHPWDRGFEITSLDANYQNPTSNRNR